MEKIVHVNTTRLFGFDKDEEGQLRVNPEQGAVVRRIFRKYLRGFGEGEIARRLRADGIPGITGASRWSSTTVRRMLQNEKYQGDLLLQKYYTVSFLTGECARNEGALDQYFVRMRMRVSSRGRSGKQCSRKGSGALRTERNFGCRSWRMRIRF